MWCDPTYTCFPCTWVLRLASRLCIPMCFWTYNHVVSCPCNSSGRRKKKRIKKNKTRSRRKNNYFFFFTCHHCRVRGHRSLYNTVVNAIAIHCRHCCRPSQFHLTSINFCLTSDSIHPTFPSINIRSSPFIPVDVPYFSNCMWCVHTYLIPFHYGCI
jgi:hypothetical protein